MDSPYKATTASENALPKNFGVRVTIEQADNGVIVKACPHNGDGPMVESEQYKDKTYVFPSLAEALKEIPAIMSVEADAKKEEESNEKIED